MAIDGLAGPDGSDEADPLSSSRGDRSNGSCWTV